MRKKPTVTVAISAYNEEKNIKNFLDSVLAQKEENFIMENIWVYSDGSNDKTVELIRSIKSSKIKVFEDKKRIGKSSRLNEIYKNLTSDILIQSDADVIFAHPRVISSIIKSFLTNPKIGMCGGSPTPLKGETFIESADSISYRIYMPILKRLRGGNNVFSADGRILAFTRGLAKKIHVPFDMIANDVFTYFCCKTLGFKYRYVPEAVVYFRCPQNLKDKLRQNKRAASIKIRMTRYFSEDLVEGEYSVPFKTRFKTILMQLLRSPIKCSCIYFINFYCSLKASEYERTLNARWPISWSTKKI